MQGKSRRQLVEEALQGNAPSTQAPASTNSQDTSKSSLPTVFRDEDEIVIKAKEPGFLRSIFPDKATKLFQRYQLDILEENLKSRLAVAESAREVREEHARSFAYQVKAEIAVHMDNQRERARAAIIANRAQWRDTVSDTIEKAIMSQMELTERTLTYIVDKISDPNSSLPNSLLTAEIQKLNRRHEERAEEIEGLRSLEIALENPTASES